MNSPTLRDLILRMTLLNPLALPSLYVSLHFAEPDADGRDEARGGSYGRQPVTLERSAVGTASNLNVVEYRDLPDVDVTHFGIWDSQVGGRFLSGGPLVSVQHIHAGQALRWDESDLQVRVG